MYYLVKQSYLHVMCLNTLKYVMLNITGGNVKFRRVYKLTQYLSTVEGNLAPPIILCKIGYK